MTWLALFPSVLVGYWYFTTFPFSWEPLYLLTLVPLILLLIGISLVSVLVFTKIGIWIVHKRITYPHLGMYRLSMDEPQTRAFVWKGNIKHIGRWMYYFFHSQFLRIFWNRRMGAKIGKHCRIGKIVLDEEFIEIGDNTFMGWKTIVGGHIMHRNRLQIIHSVIGRNCIIQNQTGVVGGKIGDNSVLKRITGAFAGQICRGNAIYQGVPIRKVKDNDLTPKELKTLRKTVRQNDKIDYIKRKNEPIKISSIKLFIMKILTVIGGLLFAAIFPLLYFLLFNSLYIPTNLLLTIALLALIPFVFLITLGFFVAGTAIIIKIFIAYYDRKAEIPEGYYEVDDPRAKYFIIKYFLRLFGLRIFRGSPFNVVDTLAMRLWGKVKFGKYVKIDVAIVDPQYIEIGDYSHIGSFCRIHTHYFVDGKLYIKTVKIGKDCLIGGYAHLKPGVEIADGSMVGSAAWFRKNRKCKRPALWMGKPAYELPLEFIDRATKVKERYVD